MNEKQAILLLKKYSKSDYDYKEVLRHSKAVQKIATEIANKINIAGKKHADVTFIKVAALLHDIGRFEYPPWICPIRHGVEGARILKKEGVEFKYQRICSHHLGAGITKKEVIQQKLPIPAKDYTPKSVEEKILCYADRRLKMTRPIRIETELKRFKKYGKESFNRLQKLHEEIQSLMVK